MYEVDQIGRIVPRTCKPAAPPAQVHSNSGPPCAQPGGTSPMQTAPTAQEKHPVSLFGELCQKKGLQVTFDVGEQLPEGGG